MNKYQLDKHMVIEASAGTGKTYTITKLISAIIREDRSKPENIVVVTYTEKAAGELKERISKEFNEAYSSSTNLKEKKLLENAIKKIDDMMISTIHGFCNSLIAEFSFENGEQFQCSLVDDSVLLPKILHSYMRKEWFTSFKTRLPEIVRVSHFISDPSGFENRIVSLANSIYSIADSENCMFNPKRMSADEIIALYDSALQKINGLRSFRDEIMTSSRAAANKTVMKIKKNILSPLARVLSSPATDAEIIGLLATLSLHELQGRMKVKSKDETQSDKEVYQILLDINSTLESINAGLIIYTVLELIEKVKHHKKEAGLISFNDMLVTVNNALKKNPEFLLFLQQKYTFGLVDEFQDTDSVQWSIFKQIFLDSHTNNKLFVIGDPKQAIYAFRNADVFTYFTATKEIADIYNGKREVLDTNYRSTESVVSGYNAIFSSDSYFINEHIQYENVNACEQDKIKAIPDKPELGFNVFRMSIENSGTKIGTFRNQYKSFIIEEIKKILSGDKIKIKREKTDTMVIPDEGDICILVSKRKDAIIVEKELKKHGINSTIYKKPGLYQSDEANALFILFDALTDIADKGKYKKLLLSDFFKLEPSVIEQNDFEELEKIAHNFVIELKNLSDTKSWTLFFSGILEKTAVIYKTIKNDSANAQRKSANYYQLIELLENEVFQKRLDLRGLRDYLHSLTNNLIRAEMETDLHRLETEDKKVQIMTIHASKGLEFSVVFLYGSLSSSIRTKIDYYVYHDDNNSNIIYDVLKNDTPINENHTTSKACFDKEIAEELRRLYYVAITRAQVMIYIPVIEKLRTEDGKVKGTRANCPSEMFLADSLIKNGKVIPGAVEIIAGQTSMYADNTVNEENSPHALSKEIANKEYFIQNVTIDSENNPLFYNLTARQFNRFFTIQSYSSIDRLLKHSNKKYTNNFEYEPLRKRKNNEVYSENDVDENEILELPSGAVTGNMLHYILETIDYSKDSASTDEIIIKAVDRYYSNRDKKIKNRYAELVATMVNNILQTQLPGTAIRLQNLKSENKKNEMEFYLKLDPEGVCFINGFIDMVYRHEDKYYILDWKSNRLPGYNGASFISDVKNHYKLQYDVYHLAVVEWLQSTMGATFNYEKNFGGIVYIYLRGVNENNEGVFFEKPDFTSYKQLRSELISQLHNISVLGDSDE